MTTAWITSADDGIGGTRIGVTDDETPKGSVIVRLLRPGVPPLVADVAEQTWILMVLSASQAHALEAALATWRRRSEAPIPRTDVDVYLETWEVHGRTVISRDGDVLAFAANEGDDMTERDALRARLACAAPQLLRALEATIKHLPDQSVVREAAEGALRKALTGRDR